MIEERRKSRRFSGNLGIISHDEEGLNFSFITNLSRQGAYIETGKVLPAGTEFQFVLSNRMLKSPVRGRVVRVRDAFFHGGKSGMGIEFQNLPGQAKIVRDDLLLYLMNLPFQEAWEAA